MSLIRFESVNDRGIPGELWSSIADWVGDTHELGLAAVDQDDFHPYLGDDVGIALSGDAGSAAAVQTVPFGVVQFTATQAADAVAGFNVDEYVDLDDSTFQKCAFAVRFKVIDDNDSSQTFIGLTDEALDGFFGADNTPDGSAFGLRWNGDETVDLVSIASDDTITVVIDAIATVARTTGWQRWGFTIENLDGTNYKCVAVLAREESSELVVSTKSATTATIPGAAMYPAVIQTNDNEAAPTIQVDWRRFYNKSGV